MELLVLKIIPTKQYFEIVKTQLSETGLAYVRVTGNSMYPLLHHLKDSVIITVSSNYKAGDVILYDRNNGRYALHRIVAIDDDHFSMMGDNQWHMEKNLSYNQILGKVSCFNIKNKSYPAEGLIMRFYTKIALINSHVRWIITRIKKNLILFIHNFKIGIRL